jgi:DNA-binding NtrC family response regulator
VKHSPDQKRSAWTLSPRARRALEAYDWPGNVRELENKIQRGTLVCGGTVIDAEHLGLPVDAPPVTNADVPTAPLSDEDAEERRELQEALVRNRGVIGRTSAELGVSRQALYRKMTRLGVSVERLLRG